MSGAVEVRCLAQGHLKPSIDLMGLQRETRIDTFLIGMHDNDFILTASHGR